MTRDEQFGRDTLPEKPKAARVIWADGFEKDYPNVRVAWGDVQRHDTERRFHTGNFEHIWSNSDGTKWIAQPIMDRKDGGRFVGLLVTFEPRQITTGEYVDKWQREAAETEEQRKAAKYSAH